MFEVEQRRRYKLKDEVDEFVLKRNGFEIQVERASKWAVKNLDDPKRMLIIKLDPPDRLVMFRFQSSEKDLDLLDEIESIKHLFDIE